MTLESNILECHVTSISYNVSNKKIPKKGEVRNRTTQEDKRIFAVWFSKKIGSVKFVFNLKKR